MVSAIMVFLEWRLSEKNRLEKLFPYHIVLGWGHAAIVCLFPWQSITKAVSNGVSNLGWVCFGLVVYRLSFGVPTSQDQTSQVEGEQPNEAAKAIKKIRTAVVVLPLLLIAASWITRDQPLLPRLVGASMNILITFWLLSQLRRLKRNAK